MGRLSKSATERCHPIRRSANTCLSDSDGKLRRLRGLPIPRGFLYTEQFACKRANPGVFPFIRSNKVRILWQHVPVETKDGENWDSADSGKTGEFIVLKQFSWIPLAGVVIFHSEGGQWVWNSKHNIGTKFCIFVSFSFTIILDFSRFFAILFAIFWKFSVFLFVFFSCVSDIF